MRGKISFTMKWIVKLTRYTSYVSKCADAIAKAVETLSNHWPTDNPFKRDPVSVSQKEGMASSDQK